MTLNEAKENKSYTITGLNGNEHFESRVSAMGIRKGVDLTVLKNRQALPLLIYSRDTMIALGRSECEKIMVGGSSDE